MEKNTATRILDVAQEMVRNRGYSAFSYADISKEVGIRKASIHYHFPSKDELVKALVKRYRANVARACESISRSDASPNEQIHQFVQLYQRGLESDQICLCSMLAADLMVLPTDTQDEIHGFFQDAEAWLTTLLSQGIEAGCWECHPSAAQEAKGLIAMLQGAQLMARSSANSAATFEQVIYPLIDAKFSKV